MQVTELLSTLEKGRWASTQLQRITTAIKANVEPNSQKEKERYTQEKALIALVLLPCVWFNERQLD